MTEQKERPALIVAALILVSILILHLQFLTVCAPLGEESFGSCVGLMNDRKYRFARLVKSPDAIGKAEPKRNIARITEHDFSPNIIQIGDWQALRWFLLQGQCHEGNP